MSTYPSITVGDWTAISPIPSLSGFAIFTFIPGRGKPTEPHLLHLSFSPATTGEVSVNPYPWSKLIPKSKKPWIASLLIAAPPAISILSFPPKLSNICLNTFLRISIPIFSKPLLILDIVATSLALPCSSMPFLIFLYIISSIKGTHTKPVTLNSAKFFCTYFNPSQNATVIPENVPYKNVQVDSKVWCSGKNDKNVSSFLISVICANAYISSQIFDCERATAFEIDVVPDVKSIIDIFLLSITTLSYLVSPLTNKEWPFWIKLE